MSDWPAIEAARRQRVPRVPFHVGGARVGSVAADHCLALRRWPRWIVRDARGLHLDAASDSRNGVLAEINARLRDDGLIAAWRDEAFALYEPSTGEVLAIFERAATRFWGTLTRGAHCNGFVADRTGRPTHLWIARRAETKATDPGKLDNLVGGGVPHGQAPHETVVREGWEEAGLTPAQMAAVQAGRVIQLDRDVPEGRMVENVHVFDLALAPEVTPRNQDGEVASIRQVPISQAKALAAGDAMTVDAALATLDFLLRHGLLARAEHEALSARMAPLFAP